MTQYLLHQNAGWISEEGDACQNKQYFQDVSHQHGTELSSNEQLQE
ncbi:MULTISPECIES: hypothetical protein [Acidithiobacillus]|nr:MULTISPECIES: hypothetical protein [Acidithiobacillus]